MRWQIDTLHQEMAVTLARKAMAAMPESDGPWLALSRALCVLGRYDDAADALTERCDARASLELHLELSDVLLQQDRFEDALAQVRAACALAPDDAAARRREMDIMLRLRQVPATAEGIIELDSAHATGLSLRAKATGPEGTLVLCDQLLADNPGNTNAKYEKSRALAKLGRNAEANALMAMQRLFWMGDLPTPDGYDSGEAFRAALEKDIRANPTLVADPRGKATREGLQTRQLRYPGAAAIEALIPLLRGAVDAYVARLEKRGDDFLLGRPAQVRLQPWAVVYHLDGYQKPHRHPSGWISGVYYVSAPRPGGENAYRGPLVMGPLDDMADPPWGVHEIEPVPGRLVLFPSYFSHATRPPGIDGARISVAFDVLPIAR